jgi:hypothetical protein
MSAREILDALPTDERNALLLSSSDEVTQELFDAAVTFGDGASMRELRLHLNMKVRELVFQRAMETLRGFAGDQDERGAWVRRSLQEWEMTPRLPEEAHLFVRAFAQVAARCLVDSKSRASVRRGQLIKAVLDEASIIEKEIAA